MLMTINLKVRKSSVKNSVIAYAMPKINCNPIFTILSAVKRKNLGSMSVRRAVLIL